jgi:hypothetical protein
MSLEESESFKDSLIDFYDREDPNGNGNLECMVLDQYFPRNEVIAAHIWKRSTNGFGLDEFNLTHADLSNPRHGLLLCKKMKKQMVKKDIFPCESNT